MSTQRPGWNKLVPSMQHFLGTLGNQTMKGYCADFVGFCDWLNKEGNADEDAICSLTHEDLTRFETHIVDAGLAARTINRKISSLRSYFNWLIEQGRIDTNPAIRLKRHKVKKVEGVVAPAVVDSLLLALKGCPFEKRDSAMLLILADHGLLPSQLVGLDMKSIKEDAQRRLSLDFRENREWKSVPLSKRTEDALREYLATRQGSSGPEAPLFINKFGGRLSSRSLRRNLSRRAEAASIPSVPTPRDFRRTFRAVA